MKQKLLSFLLITAFAITSAVAQNRVITGTVTDKSDGSPLIGVSVLIKGTRTGAQTGADGKYSISVPSGAQTLIFTYIGYVTQPVSAGSSLINVAMTGDAAQLGEVVVTALGIKRESKAIGYSTTTISNDDLTAGRSSNVVNSLAGKIAGVKILSSGGATGAASNINIRQATTFTGSNQPLFIVDGIPIDNQSNMGVSQSVNTGGTPSNRGIDLNQDDIESISILKGPAAAVLYGSRAGAGAVLITTKRGSKNSVAKVQFSSFYNVQEVNRLPDYQNTYAQGIGGGYDSFSQMSWGPKITGQTVVNYLGNNEVLAAQPDNVKDIFQKGYTWQNNLTFTGGGEKNTYYFSYGNYSEEGYINNNNLTKNNFTYNGTTELTSKLSSTISGQFINSNAIGTQVSNERSNPLFDGMTLPRTYNLLNYPFERGDGSTFIPSSKVNNANYTYYNVAGTDNPLWSIKNVSFGQKINRVIGNVGFDYKVRPWLSANYKIGVDSWTNTQKTINAKGANNNQSAGRVGSVIDATFSRNEVTSYFNLTANKKLTQDFNLRVLLGNEVNYRRIDQIRVTGNSIQDPTNFNVANTLTFIPAQQVTTQSLIGVYGDASVDYKGMAYLSFTGRNDISSTFSANKRSYFYPEVSGSLILNEAIPALKETSWLTYLKLRGNYAKIGREAPAYATSTYYGGATPSDGFSNSLIFPFNGVNGQTYNDAAGNVNLGPEFTATREGGLEGKLFNSRINFDFTYYNTLSTDIIFSVPKANSSGFSSLIQNAGKLKTSGIETMMGGTPIKTRNFSWDLSANFTRGRSKVIKLAAGVPFIGNGGFTNPQGRIVEGLQYGTLFGQVFTKLNGKDVVDANGRLSAGQINATLAILGDPNPKWTGGVNTGFSYKGLSLNAFVDIRYGGDIYSRTITDIRRYGVGAETGDRNRLYVHNAVNADGTPNNVLITAEQYYGDLFSSAAQQYATFDGSWLRLRDASLSYRIPGKIISKSKFVRGVDVGLTGHNLLLYAPNFPHIDPENNLLGVSNGQGIEYNGQPQTRTYGGFVKFTF